MDTKEIFPIKKYMDIEAGEYITLDQTGSWPESVHEFDLESIWAIEAAIAAQRPLLIKGKPGTGKSQLARAAAHKMKRVFISEVVNSSSEASDLLWKFDAVGRLGEAQISRHSENSDILDYKKYISPGPLWWAFNWKSASKQRTNCNYKTFEPVKPYKKWQQKNGTVLLIDEIDKADSDLPNGLLEILGNGAFSVPYINEIIGMDKNSPVPLVVITTNGERELPAAFIRRCLVLNMSLPKDDNELKKQLKGRAEIHFENRVLYDSVLEEAAEQLIDDRQFARQMAVPEPGQAEYLDLIRAVTDLSNEEEDQLKALEVIKSFTFKKNN